MSSSITITISRQIGCGGAYIGQEVAKSLGCRYLDREIVRHVANHLKEDESLLIDRQERISSFWENLVRSCSVCIPETGYIPPPVRPIMDSELFAVEALIIRKIAERYSSVIVGRGAFHILSDISGLVNVFLHATPEFRLRRVMDVFDIKDSEKAKNLIEDSDRQRRKFIRVLSGRDWTDARNYHLSIDTGVVGFADACEMILCRAKTLLAER
ncbi:MAG TPA: cytidylate kinase-like family protein [Geobacteraceae bacterium]|nr:cytidylate kinase-like family protein [Geobacteraceae bacterium]